jgi:hypothetical protein
MRGKREMNPSVTIPRCVCVCVCVCVCTCVYAHMHMYMPRKYARVTKRIKTTFVQTFVKTA